MHKVITDALGLCVLVVAAMSIAPLFHDTLANAIGSSLVFIAILISVLGGTFIGALMRIEDLVGKFGVWLLTLAGSKNKDESSHSSFFMEAFITGSLFFCIGPLSILCPIAEGLGRGPDQLITKSMLDFFSAIALASTLKWGVMASVIPLVIIEGGFTVLGAFMGTFISDAEIDAMSIAGGIILIGVAMRLLDLKKIRVADMLPALILAPLIVAGLSKLS